MYLLAKIAVGMLTMDVILGSRVHTLCSAANESTGENLLKIHQMETRLAIQDAKLAKQEAINMGLEAKISALQASLGQAITQWSESRETTSFLAVRTMNNIIPRKGTVIFDTIKHNTAPPLYGYDEKIGYYRCPFNGTYAFYVNILGDGTSTDKIYSFAIKKGSVTLVTASTEVEKSGTADDQPASAMAVTPCGKGEYVRVENIDDEDRKIWVNNGRTHFAGFKIY